MTDRHTVNTITSDALDALYEQLEAAENSEAQRQLATAREAFASATSRAARAEADLAALRAVARGYCPHCGRGDAGITTDQWERERQRANEAEGRLAHLQASSEAAGRYLTRTVDEHNQLRAAIRRLATLIRAGAPWAANHDTGPTVAEAAANDRRRPLEKPGE
jgi:DNA repair exonuclease SbcCD ATPase subunit